jgi:hypothetical protein
MISIFGINFIRLKIKKVQAYKPGFVFFSRKRILVIYLGFSSQKNSIDLPASDFHQGEIGRAALGPKPI